MRRHPGKRRVMEGLGKKKLCLPTSLSKIFAMLLPHLLVTGCPGWQEAAVALWAGDMHSYPGSCAWGEQTGGKRGFADHDFFNIHTHTHTCVFSIQSFLFPCNNSGRYLITGVGIACHCHCPECFTHPSLLVPTRCGGI